MERPLGRKAYGSIPHLPGSRAGNDRHLPLRQAERLTVEAPRGHSVVVQEKLDGSCVAAARVGDAILALGRAGDLAALSRNPGRQLWAAWVAAEEARFREFLAPGEWVVGEWLALAHSTRYALVHEPFVAFDLMREGSRTPTRAFFERAHALGFATPHEVHRGTALPVDEALALLGQGGHGAMEVPEGVMYRLESAEGVALIAKHVRSGKADGTLLPENSGQPAIWNWRPASESTA